MTENKTTTTLAWGVWIFWAILSIAWALYMDLVVLVP